MSPTKQYVKKHAKARQRRRLKAHERLDRDRRQAEWNALHYEILQRLALDISRASIESQSLALRVESLAAKVDFNERRVRTMEGTQVRTPRPQESSQPAQVAVAAAPPAAPEGALPQPPAPVKVSKRDPAGPSVSSRWTSASSRSRPRKLLSWSGRL